MAAELGCDWHPANRAVLAWGEALLAADTARVGAVEALGLDESLFGRQGAWRTRSWFTSVVDVQRGQLLDIVPGRDAAGPTRWLLGQPEAWRQSIAWGVLDLSGAYRRAFDEALPHGEVRLAWHANQTLRGLYDIDCPQLAERHATELAADLRDADCPPELRRLGRTLGRWHTQIVNWHHARVSNGPTEAFNNLIKRVKRAAFGFRRFAHYRIRALLYDGNPNWTLLNGLTPR